LVDDLRRARDVVDVTYTTAGIHRHGRHVTAGEEGWWLGGPAKDLPAPVSVLGLCDHVIRAGGALGCNA
jgi:hypothetical protein